MKTIDNIMHHLAGHGLIEALAETMREASDEFADDEKAYSAAVDALREALPKDFSPSLDEFISAHEKDIISRTAYAGYLGYRVNLDNFHNPYGVQFLHLDTIDYVKDHLFGHFPVNYEAARTHEAFYRALPDELKKYEDAISSYFCHMECAGPKLAHYAGYIIANHLLPWVEPGYRADWFQTDRFKDDMKKYMDFLPM